MLWTSSSSSGLPQNGNNLGVAAVCFSPDGTRLLAAVATRVLLYDAATGALLNTLKSHKAAIVSAVDWSLDGARFVSGDVEGKVIIWTGAGEGLLKYTHSHSGNVTEGEGAQLGVGQVTHNPITHQLCSAAAREFALWSSDQKAVVKKKVPHVIARVAWRGDGEYLALGFAHGVVSLRESTSLTETAKIVCQPGMDVMTWMAADVLVVGKEQTLSVYHDGGKGSEDVLLDSAILVAQYIPGMHAVVLLLRSGNVLLYRDDGTSVQAIYQGENSGSNSSSLVTIALALDRLALGFEGGTIGLVCLPPPSQQPANSIIDNDWQAAVDSQIAHGDLTLALATLRQHGLLSSLSSSCSSSCWEGQVLAVARAAQDPALVRMCGSLLADTPLPPPSSATSDKEASARRDRALREIFLSKLQDVSLLMAYYTRGHMWTEALALAEDKAGFFDPSTFLPYAEWLLVEDPQRNFDQAVSLYYRYDAAAQTKPFVEALVRNAVIEGRFQDASYYCWVLAVDAFRKIGSNDTNNGDYEGEYRCLSTLADVYGAFQHIHAYAQEPFTALSPLTLFQVARFVLNTLGSGEPPFGISKVATLYTITKQAQALGARTFARFCYARLLTLHLPPSWRDALEVDMLHLQAAELGDEGREESELHPVCYQCGHINPFLNPANQHVKESLIVQGGRGNTNGKGCKTPVRVSGGSSDDGGEWAGDACVTCGHPFVRSMLCFEVLPLVEFMPDPALSDEEVVALLRIEPRTATSSAGDSLHFPSPPSPLSAPPSAAGGVALEGRRTAREYMPVVVDAATLQALRPEEVFVCRPMASSGAHEVFTERRRGKEDSDHSSSTNSSNNNSTSRRSRFFRNMLYPDIPLALSQAAQRFFSEEHFEMAYLQAAAAAPSSASQRGRREMWEQGKTEALTATCPFSRVRDVGEYGPLA